MSNYNPERDAEWCRVGKDGGEGVVEGDRVVILDTGRKSLWEDLANLEVVPERTLKILTLYLSPCKFPGDMLAFSRKKKMNKKDK